MNRSPNEEKAFEKAFNLVSLGCPKNRVDSERILHSMAQNGFVFTDDPSHASIVIVNTCAFIQSAVEESLSVILELRETAPHASIIVAGCLPLRYKDDLAMALSEADMFITPPDIPLLPKILKNAAKKVDYLNPLKRKRPRREAQVGSRLGPPLTTEESEHHAPEIKQPRGRVITTPGYAYLKIADGCNRSCNYCTIPDIRGPFESTPLYDLVQESQDLAEKGVKEIILVAQDTANYGRDLTPKNGLLKLISAITKIQGIQWIRLMYLHPVSIPRGLPQLINESEKLLPYLDIPFQHVSEKVLRAMGRPWKGDYIRKLVDTLREKIPGLVLRTTLMVGFPGEDDTEFNTLRNFVESYRIEHVGVFEYSPEENTPAFDLQDPVPRALKKQRADELMRLNVEFTSTRNRQRIGATNKALIHGVSTESEFLLEGRLWDQAPEVDGLLYITDGIAQPGAIQDVIITDVYETDLFGTVQGELRLGPPA